MEMTNYEFVIIKVNMINHHNKCIGYEYDAEKGYSMGCNLRTLVLKAIDAALYWSTPDGDPEPIITSITIIR